jgi:YidC/Oxa1 family membrane protein insertase
MFKDIVAAHGHLNAFGLDLSHGALRSHSSVAAALPYWILLLIMAGTSYLQTAQTMSRNPQASQNPQMRVMKFLPLIFVVFCINFPAGVVLYYSMSNVCRIIQQDLMYRFDPKVKALVAEEVREVEAITRDIDERPDRARGQVGLQATPKGGDGGGKRTRFRDLLAAAAEQQQKAQDSKRKEIQAKSSGQAPGTGAGVAGGEPKPKAGPSQNPASGTASGNGARKGGGSSNGAQAGRPGTNGQRGGNRPKSGGRRNRRRRGR